MKRKIFSKQIKYLKNNYDKKFTHDKKIKIINMNVSTSTL